MITLNPYSFFEGANDQAAENRRAAAEDRALLEEQRRQTLFDQVQADYSANTPLRAAQRDRALFGATTGLATERLALPGQRAQAAFTDTVQAAQRGAVGPNIQALAQAAAQAQRSTAEAGATSAATKAVLALDEQQLVMQPELRRVRQQVGQLREEAAALDAMMGTGRMDLVNATLRARGMEAQFDGAVPMVRQIGETAWTPWVSAMALPMYQRLTVNLDHAAQAGLRDAQARHADAQARAVGAGGAPPTLGIPSGATPLPGAAPAPKAAATPGPPSAPVLARPIEGLGLTYLDVRREVVKRVPPDTPNFLAVVEQLTQDALARASAVAPSAGLFPDSAYGVAP